MGRISCICVAVLRNSGCSNRGAGVLAAIIFVRSRSLICLIVAVDAGTPGGHPPGEGMPRRVVAIHWWSVVMVVVVIVIMVVIMVVIVVVVVRVVVVVHSRPIPLLMRVVVHTRPVLLMPEHPHELLQSCPGPAELPVAKPYVLRSGAVLLVLAVPAVFLPVADLGPVHEHLPLVATAALHPVQSPGGVAPSPLLQGGLVQHFLGHVGCPRSFERKVLEGARHVRLVVAVLAAVKVAVANLKEWKKHLERCIFLQLHASTFYTCLGTGSQCCWG